MTIVPVELLGRRVARLQEAMAGAGIDTLLVTELPSVRWLTGFSGSAGRALVRPTGAAVLVTDDRYTLRAKAEAPAAELVIDRTWGWLGDTGVDGSLAVQADVLPWADEILVLRRGQLVQQGPPERLYHQPVDEYTAAKKTVVHVQEGSSEQGGSSRTWRRPSFRWRANVLV